MKKVLQKVKMNLTTPLHEIRKLKVGYFGHIKRHGSLEKHILEAKRRQAEEEGEDQ